MEPARIEKELHIGYGSHAGMSGKGNEDYLGVFAWKLDGKRRFQLGVVADGVGGQTAGEVASHLAVNTVQKYFDKQGIIENYSRHLERAILAANEAVYRSSQENPAYRGMSTTMVLAALVDNRLFTAHVGDSRIYLLRDGRLRQISIDHTWAQEAIEAGLLTREQAKTHPNRNVIRRHLGGRLDLEVDHRLALSTGQTGREALANQGTPVKAGDTILLCSDGLTDMIGDHEVLKSLQTHYTNLPTASKELIDKANRAGGKDNITLVILQVPPTKDQIAAMAKGAKLPATPPAAAPAAPTVAQRPLQTQPAKKGFPFLLVGGAIMAIAAIAAIVFFVILGPSDDNGGTTPVATDVQDGSPDIIESTLPPGGAPATAAILLGTAGSQPAEGEDGVSPLDTPVLLPTLRATQTATRRSLPSSTPSPSVTASLTRRPGVSPSRTPTKLPTNTPPGQSATNTPTNTPVPSVTPLPTSTQPIPPTETVAPTETLTPKPIPSATATTSPTSLLESRFIPPIELTAHVSGAGTQSWTALSGDWFWYGMSTTERWVWPSDGIYDRKA